jgi:hypothetical protein
MLANDFTGIYIIRYRGSQDSDGNYIFFEFYRAEYFFLHTDVGIGMVGDHFYIH